MSCGHCTAAIEKSVKAADPAAKVACDLSTHMVEIESALPESALGEAISEAGYDARRVAEA